MAACATYLLTRPEQRALASGHGDIEPGPLRGTAQLRRAVAAHR